MTINTTTVFTKTLAHSFGLVFGVVFGVAFALFVHATPKPEQNLNLANLSEKQSSLFDHYYSGDNTNFSQSKYIFIETPTLSFDQKWTKDFKFKVSNRYQDRINTSYTELMLTSLSKALEDSNEFEIVTNKEKADLIVKPYITELYINGPEYSSGITKTFVNNAGRATVNFVVLTPDEQLKAKLIDQRETRNWTGITEMRQANRATNYRDFKFLFERWSKNLVKQLTSA